MKYASPKKMKSLLFKGVEKEKEVKRVVNMKKMRRAQKSFVEFEGIVNQESVFGLWTSRVYVKTEILQKD